MSDYILEFHESRVTLGGGQRKREIVNWECVWTIPIEMLGNSKIRQITGKSSTSKADAESKTRLLIADFLNSQ